MELDFRKPLMIESSTKVLKTIESCTFIEQLEKCRNLINSFAKMYFTNKGFKTAFEKIKEAYSLKKELL